MNWPCCGCLEIYVLCKITLNNIRSFKHPKQPKSTTTGTKTAVTKSTQVMQIIFPNELLQIFLCVYFCIFVEFSAVIIVCLMSALVVLKNKNVSVKWRSMLNSWFLFAVWVLAPKWDIIHTLIPTHSIPKVLGCWSFH